MSIQNLSNGHAGLSHLNARPTFLRDESMPLLINTLERYDRLQGQDSLEQGGNQALFTGGESSTDYKGLAKAMLERLAAMRDRMQNASQGGDGRFNQKAEPHSTSAAGWNQGWWKAGQWYATADAPTKATSNSVTMSSPSPAPAPPPTTVPNATTASPPTASPTAGVGSTSSYTQPSSSTIVLSDGASTIADTVIVGDHGIMADNATHVTTLDVSNTIIQSTNYGIYLGYADTVNLRNVDITASPSGGDSYSIRGHIRSLTSSDSTFNAGSKAYRIYGLESGSSTRDTYTGDRLMLGGGYANEWGEAATFRNFTFTQGSINVNSVEIYDNTSNIVFDGVDFAGTGHISIQAGAHDITFRNCANLPTIRLYDGQGGWSTLPAESARNISVVSMS